MTTTTPVRTPSHVARLLGSALESIRAEMTAAPPEALRWRPDQGEWCVLEVVGHLIEAEQRGFAGRIRQILERPGLDLASWDQVAVAASRRDRERDPAALLEEFARLRADAVGLVSGLADADLVKHGEHPKVGRLRVRDLLHEWVHHDRNHIRQMMANLQGFVWLHMANAQRFSEEEAAADTRPKP